jgi:hypothetical protein
MAHYCAFAVAALCSGACVDLAKPEAVAKCAAVGNCVNGGLSDAEGMGPRDASGAEPVKPAGPDGAPAISPEAGAADQVALPDLRPADLTDPGVEVRQPGDLATAGDAAPEGPLVPPDDARVADRAGDEPTPDLGHGNEAAPDQSPPLADARPEPGAEVGREVAPELGAEPGREAGPESGPEVGPEAGPEPGPEAGPEPGPEAGPEAAGKCPVGGICDDFEDGNFSANPAWTAPSGFGVTTDGTKVLAYTGSSTPAIATVGGAATAMTIKAKVKATAFGGTSNSYRVGVFGRVSSQGSPSTWYGLTITGDGSLRLQVTDSTPSGCSAVAGASQVNAWYVLTLVVSGTVASTTLQGTLTDETGGNAKTIGPCTISGGFAAGWAGVGVRGGGTQGEFDEVQITDITP